MWSWRIYTDRTSTRELGWTEDKMTRPEHNDIARILANKAPHPENGTVAEKRLFSAIVQTLSQYPAQGIRQGEFVAIATNTPYPRNLGRDGPSSERSSEIWDRSVSNPVTSDDSNPESSF
jgi:hypothetical protein